MAIQKDIDESKFGMVILDAYYRIVQVSVVRHYELMVDIALVAYSTKPTSMSVNYIDEKRYNIRLKDIEEQEGDTFLAKCYNWLSKLPEFANSVGV